MSTIPTPDAHGEYRISWDWKDQPDLDELTAILAQLGVSCRDIETGRDDYEIALGLMSTTPTTETEPCPTCSGPTRETVGMVCQTCGRDFAPVEPVDLDAIEARASEQRHCGHCDMPLARDEKVCVNCGEDTPDDVGDLLAEVRRLRATLATSAEIQMDVIRVLIDGLGLDHDNADDCLPGCDAGPAGSTHMIWHLVPTPAEIDAGTEALAQHVDAAGRVLVYRDGVTAILRAVLPDHDAALAERIARGIETTNHHANAGCECDAQDAQAIAAAIARAHATPPEEPDNAQ